MLPVKARTCGADKLEVWKLLRARGSTPNIYCGERRVQIAAMDLTEK